VCQFSAQKVKDQGHGRQKHRENDAMFTIKPCALPFSPIIFEAGISENVIAGFQLMFKISRCCLIVRLCERQHNLSMSAQGQHSFLSIGADAVWVSSNCIERWSS